MNTSTKIQWTEVTWNPLTGCDIVSPGCKNCYAEYLTKTRLVPAGNPRYRNGFLAFKYHAGALVLLVQAATKENANVQETYNISYKGLLNYGFTVTVGGETFGDALDAAKEIVENIVTPLRKLDEQIEAHLLDILPPEDSHDGEDHDGD